MVDKTNEGTPAETVTENTGASFEGTTAQSVDMGNVTAVRLEDELRQSFIDYAMSVIVDRALPDVRDGLKPVHRRVLFDMYKLKIWHNGPTKKSARVVGDVIGRFHPHGDAAVYDTIVRMAQWFSMRNPLVFGQGNFGNIDGDGPAAMRYTEVRMTRIAEAMLQDIDKETVNTYPNYDGNEQIPEVLPTRFPNLLVNGSSGIAVGMATNIPPHNLGEVIDGTLALLDKPEITLDELMHYIKAPDFPTGGFIVGTAGVREAYATGKGRVVMRARTHVETDKSGRRTIIVDEIPYMEAKSNIVKQIAELVRDKKIEGIAEVNDLSDKDHQVRIAIDLKRDAFEEAVLNNLYEKTSLQSNFAVNMIALVGQHPRQLSLIEILKEFINFRREVVTRRTVYLLRQDRKKAFLDEGLIVAKGNIDRVIEIITSSENTEEAKQRLVAEAWDGTLISTLIHLDERGENVCLPQGIEKSAGLHDGKYHLSVRQAERILEMQLSSLTRLNSEKIQAEYRGLIANILGYLEILNSTERLKEVIREELKAARSDFADKRRSEIIGDMGRVSKADLIAPQDAVITLSDKGYIKYQDISAFESQRRGGKGRAAARVKDDDIITRTLVTNTHHILLCLTSQGRLFASWVYDLPTSENRTWRGRPIQNYFAIEEGERVTSMLSIAEFDENHFIFMVTARGLVKKIRLSEYRHLLTSSAINSGRPVKITTLMEGDELVDAQIGSGDDDIYLFTANGKALRFCDYYDVSKDGDESEAESAEENAGETLTEESEIASGAESDNGEEIKVEVVRNRHFGYGVRPSGRTSRGIRGMRLVGDDRIVSLIVITPDGKDRHYAIILTAKGKGKKMVLEELTLRNRGGQGIMVMPSRAGEKNGPVIGATRVEDGDEFLIITDQGTLIRSPVDESLRPMSRMAVGVILMRPGDNENIIALETIPCEVAEASREAQNARRQEKKDREAMELMVSGGSAVTQNGAEKTEDAAQDSDPGYDVDQGAEGTATLADNEEK